MFLPNFRNDQKELCKLGETLKIIEVNISLSSVPVTRGHVEHAGRD